MMLRTPPITDGDLYHIMGGVSIITGGVSNIKGGLSNINGDIGVIIPRWYLDGHLKMAM